MAASLLFVYAVVAFLGWWRPVFVDDRPVQRWVVAVPVIMLVAIVAGTNYGGLADRGLAFALLLLLSTLMVGFAEEGMFRGIGVSPCAQRVHRGQGGAVDVCPFVSPTDHLVSEGPKR